MVPYEEGHVRFILQIVYELIIQIFECWLFFVKSKCQARQQFRTLHNITAAMIFAELYSDWAITISFRAQCTNTKYQLWAHILFAKRVRGASKNIQVYIIPQITLWLENEYIRKKSRYITAPAVNMSELMSQNVYESKAIFFRMHQHIWN